MLRRAVARAASRVAFGGGGLATCDAANGFGKAATVAAMAMMMSSKAGGMNWVFLGPPGVGKGTYASRVGLRLGLPHISTGDLIRTEIAKDTETGRRMDQIVSKGQLLPNKMILQLLRNRLSHGERIGESGFILDGFPRTLAQAEQLVEFADLQLVVNLSLREEVLIQKCLGRRLCSHCGKNYNVANINLPADGDKPEIIMPPLPAPKECLPHLLQRPDDTEEVIRKRLEVYKKEATPIEKYFKTLGIRLDFDITGGIPETLPVLLEALKPHMQGVEPVPVAA